MKDRVYLKFQREIIKPSEKLKVLKIQFEDITGMFLKYSSNMKNIPRLCTLFSSPHKKFNNNNNNNHYGSFISFQGSETWICIYTLRIQYRSWFIIGTLTLLQFITCLFCAYFIWYQVHEYVIQNVQTYVFCRIFSEKIKINSNVHRLDLLMCSCSPHRVCFAIKPLESTYAQIQKVSIIGTQSHLNVCNISAQLKHCSIPPIWEDKRLPPCAHDPSHDLGE